MLLTLQCISGDQPDIHLEGLRLPQYTRVSHDVSSAAWIPGRGEWRPVTDTDRVARSSPLTGMNEGTVWHWRWRAITIVVPTQEERGAMGLGITLD
jgi:hypothetical protein